MARRNRFFVWQKRAVGPTEFDPCKLTEQLGESNLGYYSKLAIELDCALKDQSLTFLLTWHLDAFDERLRDAIVILLGDEKHQIPSYIGDVRAIFKTGGIKRNPWRSLVRMAPSVAWRVALRDTRNTLLAYRRKTTRRRPMAPLFELPIGYHALQDVTWVPFRERTTDVFFAGSVESARGLTVRPRLTARRQMLASLTSASEQLCGLRIDWRTSGLFGNPEDMLDPQTYSRHLMNARIVLCPRGNMDETYRLVEAAKSGSVAIVERLPDRWYNRDSPAVQIERWSSLPKVLARLLSDSELLARKSEQMYRWWTERLSERAAARFVVEALSTLGPRS